MENKNYSTVFEADLAYLRSLGDTSECKTEFEVRLKTLRKLGGDIQTTTPLLYEIEKKILDFLGGDSSLYDNIYFLRKAIAERQGVNTEGLQTIYAIAVASLNSKPIPSYEPYVTFTAEEANSKIGLNQLSTKQTLEYSTDTTNWNPMSTSTNISLPNIGDKVYIRGILSADNTNSDYTQFKMTGKIAASGNCNAIWNYQDLNAPLKKYCGCFMFFGCSSLTTAPALPATELTEGCYKSLFNSCRSLTTAPELPATTLAFDCYYQLLSSCTSLTTAPELPATELAKRCYCNMFRECTSLTTAPELPATTLETQCYSSMFYGCTSLTTAPELPATTLVDNCYSNMFEGCTKLNKITCLATNISAASCTSNWMYRVSTTGTFIKNPDMNNWLSNSSGIPDGWFVEDIGFNYYTIDFVEDGKLLETKRVKEGEVPTYTGAIPVKSYNEDFYYELSGWYPALTAATSDFTYTAQLSLKELEPLSGSYVTFEAPFGQSTIGLTKLSTNQSLEYRTNDIGWVELNKATTIPVHVDDKVYIRGILSADNSSSDYTKFKMTGKIAVSGNCNAIWNYQDLNAPLKKYCGYSLFEGCTSLVTAPALPATKLASYCYQHMFSSCIELTTAPALPATELAYYCYGYMFRGCTSLITAPELPATTLASYCYDSMFNGCTSLTEAPELPATTLITYCYRSMFSGCSKLNKITCLATTKYNLGYGTDSWVYRVSSSGTFIKNPDMNDWTTGNNGIPSGWTVEDYGEPDLTLPYVTFTAEEANSTIGLEMLSLNQTLEYSTDTTNWNTMDTSTSISLPNIGDKVYIRGILSADNDSSNYTRFEMTGKIAASGNCNAIWDYQDLETALKQYCGSNMFYNCDALTQAPELPATTLASNCYASMFDGCTSLTTAPELPATELAPYCYKLMFYGCTSLTTAPELPATTLVDNCYWQMFRDCSSLTTAPTLPATTLAEDCYEYMFSGCTKLTTAPELPATTLANYCYSYMFKGCTSLTTAPELPATTLASRCYQYMFNGCTSLVTAPTLPATTLKSGCYSYMFNGCTKLNKITCLATNSHTSYTSLWVQGVPSTGTFIKNPAMTSWSTGVNGIPDGWTVEDYVG